MDGKQQQFPGSEFASGRWTNGFALRVERAGDGTYTASYAFAAHQEGPPGVAHGGAIATVLDELMTAAVYESVHVLTYTVNLNVNYRAPVPLGMQINVHAKIDHIEGRKLFASARMLAQDGRALAEATGLFVMSQSDSSGDDQ